MARKLGRRENRKVFHALAGKTNIKNVKPKLMRGGVRL